MDDDDFYEDDEPIEKIRADYAAGEKGVTVSRRDLNQRAAAIVGQIAEASAAEPESTPELRVIDGTAWFSSRAHEGTTKTTETTTRGATAVSA